MNRKLSSVLRLLISSLLVSSVTEAAQPLTNGDFETGTLSAWSISSTQGAVVEIAQKNTCFSAVDTTQINIRGNYAALLRSNVEGDETSRAILTSPAFNAGDGVAFIAPSESLVGFEKETVHFEVQILDATNDAIVVSQILKPATALLHGGCPNSEDNASHFRSHYVSTRAYVGKGIKIRFVQNTKESGSPNFTLIDQVIKFNQAEQPIFYSRPHPQAGVSETHWGTPYLDSAGSFDSDKKIKEITYSWYIDSEEVRESRNPCVADLADGNHTAALYVNDGQYALSDVIHFVIDVPTDMREDFTAQIPSNNFASINPVAQDPECSSDLLDYIVEVNSPDVDVNDHLAIEEEYDTGDATADDANEDDSAETPTFSAQF
jgi:hypothetical protein